MTTNAIYRMLSRIMDRYDAENDIGGITWVDMDMATAIITLAGAVERLEDEVKELRGRLNHDD